MADKHEKRDVKVASKQERVARMLTLLNNIAAKAVKAGGSLGEEISINEEGKLQFTRGSLKEYDNEQQDLYGYLHYLLMKTSLHIEKAPKEGKGKQYYLYVPSPAEEAPKSKSKKSKTR